MDTNLKIRVPVDDDYASLVGKAVYIFAYYEWGVIWIIEYLQAGFVSGYCRGKPMTSGRVARAFADAIVGVHVSAELKAQLEACHQKFADLIVERNALIHAHPCTDDDGSQILNFQSSIDRPLPDMKWKHVEIERLIQQFDEAACDANALLYRLREPRG